MENKQICTDQVKNYRVRNDQIRYDQVISYRLN